MDNSDWKAKFFGILLLVLLIGGLINSNRLSSQQKREAENEAPIQQMQKQEPVKQQVKQPVVNNVNSLGDKRMREEYAIAHKNSYDNLAESLEFMGMANESMRAITAAYYKEDGETMFTAMFVYNTALERARESAKESEQLIINMAVPVNIINLHSQWIRLIDDFGSLPDRYADVMPKVVDGKAGAVEDAEALAGVMQELPHRATDLSKEILSSLGL